MSAFYYIGLLCSAYVAIRMLRYLSKLVRQRGLNVGELGDWALVTGATDGIGKAFVKVGIYILHKIFSHHYLNKNYVCRRVRGGEVAKLNISFFSILSLLSETVKIRMSSLKLFTSSLYIMFFSSSNYL